eukprot:TRINITY_DN11343_c0_g1_i1.p2 TRINITY_DN11343_c0_g1~~TRINITY_DN11343_c0_g1_i1.p2  ORF type:complete len:245 (+),score=65.15 TRINITY_DN11343_c0_g1_i1:1598-2332(+)
MKDHGYRNRSCAAVDLDDFMKTVFEGLEQRGVLNNTYIVWSGDNGFHLGEHKLLKGKTEPYETDIRVPMFVRGPGIAQGQRLPYPSNHVDITRTIVDWAQIAEHAPQDLDGKSFAEVLENPVPLRDWRTWGFSEFYVDDNTWQAVRVINETTGQADVKFTLWCTNQTEVFDLANDEWELDNQGGTSPTTYGRHVQAEWMPVVSALGSCKAETCQHPKAKPVPVSVLPCHNTGPAMDIDEAWYDP